MQPSNPTQDSRPIGISTPLGKDVLLLVSFKLREELAAPFSMDLKLQSLNPDIPFSSLIGQSATVSLILANKQVRYFNGIISQFSLTGFEQGEGGRFANYRAVMVPWIWILSRASHCRIFEEATVPEIVKKVSTQHGFSDIAQKLQFKYRPLPYCVQYDESDMNFLNRLMEWQGIYYYFEHTQQDHTLVLCDADTPPPVFPGYESIPYNPQKHGPHMAEHIHDWVCGQEVTVGKIDYNDYDYLHPKLPLDATASASLPYTNTSLSRYAYPGHYHDEKLGSALAAIRLHELTAQGDTRHGFSNVLGIAAGHTFSFSNFPRQDQNTSFFVTSMDLSVVTASFATGDDAAPIFNAACDFRAIPATSKYCPPRRTQRPRMRGPQTATVISNSPGSLVDADKYGNVRVRFHWGKSKENASCYIRVAQFAAGDSWGALFLPHVGNEVVVNFEDGDPDRPLITGRVYNADQEPPFDPTLHPLYSVIEDSSEKNLIRLDATDAAQKVLIQNGNNSMLMDSTSGADGIIITDGKSWIKFDTPSGDVATSVENDSNSFVQGDQHAITEGTSETVVLGLATNLVLGGNVGLSAPFTWDNFLGIRMEILVGLDVSLHAGWSYEKHKVHEIGKARETPIDLTKTDFAAYKHKQLITQTDEEVRQVAGGFMVTAEALQLTATSTLLVDSESTSEITTGIRRIQTDMLYVDSATGMNFTTPAELVVDASVVSIAGDIVELG